MDYGADRCLGMLTNALAWPTDHSIFVGDLAADVTDFILQEHFRQYYPSVRSAKACCLFCSNLLLWAPAGRPSEGQSFTGTLRLVQVITDPMTGRSKGYGFVRLGSEQERDRALTEMQVLTSSSVLKAR